VHITKTALTRFGIDHIWWLVSPGNPLKDTGPAPLDTRLDAARHIMQHPKVTVTDLETHLGTRYTAQTLRKLQARYRGVRFIWLMGADNMVQFHHWQDWRWIVENVAIGVIARPNERIAARLSMAAHCYRGARLRGRSAVLLARRPAPAWCFINAPMMPHSSTEIRARGDW
jgi:nicotinate-nucleotide adenylyltransferase